MRGRSSPNPASFLAGGEMGERFRAHDWSATPLGGPAGWPAALRTLIEVMLGSKQPIFVTWGPERTLLYNDGYAGLLGRKHPDALGRPFLDVWSEIRADLQPLLDQVDAGESVHMDDIRLVLERHGYPEEAHFAFSYSPVRDEAGRVAGLFCPCQETTGQVLAERRATAERERLRELFQQAPGFMALLRGPEHVFELVNAAYLQLVGHRDALGKPVREALPEVEGQGFFELLDRVYATGEAFRGEALRVGLQRAPGAPMEERFVDLVYQPVTDAEGWVAGIFVEGSDVTERVRAEAALREREERLRLVVEGAKDHAILTTDPQGAITTWSAGAEAVFGWTAEEAVGRSASMLFTPEDRAAGADWRELATAAREGCAPDERWHLRKDGSRVFMNGSVRPLHDANGQGCGFFKIARDETARRTMDEGAAKLAAIVSTTPDAVISFSGEDGRITSWNKGAEHLFGYAEAEAIGAPVGARMTAPDGRVLGVSGIFRDVTARKRAEAALCESEARFRNMADHAPVMMWVTDADGHCTYLNRRWYEWTGQSQAEAEGFGWLDATHPDDKAEAERVFLEANARRQPFRLEYRLRRADGAYRWAIDAASPRFGAGGEFLGFIGSVIDIDERKQAESRRLALAELSDRFRDLDDPADISFAAAEILGRTLGVSRAGYGTIDTAAETITIERDWNAPGIRSLAGVLRFRDYGSYIEDLKLGRTVVFADAETDPRTAATADALKAISAQSVVNMPVTERGGFVALLYLNHATARGWSPDELAFVREVAERTRDAVERRRAEQELRESEEHYRHAAELNPQVAWTATPDGQLDRVAERWRTWTGTGGLGDSWGEGLHADDLGHTAEAWRRSVATGEPYDVEHRVKMRSGAYCWARSRAFPRRDADGRIVKWYGSTEDIHERKLAEERLRASEARFQAIADSIDQMIWSTRPDGFHDYYNQRWYEYTGVPEGSTDGEAWNGMFHPEDQPRAWAVWQRSLETGEPYRIEYRLRHRSGQYRWVLGRAQAVRDEDGRIVRWFGTCTDIQEIVEAREVLARSREELEHEVAERTAERNVLATIVETTDAFVQVVDLDFRWLAINPAAAGEFERIYGVRPTVGQSMLDLLADRPEHRAAVEAVWSRALAGEEFTETAEFGDPGLDRRRYEMKFNVLKDANGERIGAFQIVTDATERLQKEAALAEAQEQLRQAQKMEAVGQLTGGIAHDFNNLLAGIVGSLDLMQTRIAQGRTDTVERYAKAAMSSAQRAAALTHRLLAFSRRQPLDPKPVNANALVASMEDLLRRTIGPLHTLELVTAGGLWTTLCDPNQLESAILNLAINARDAMPDGGKLTIETANAHLDDAYAAASRDVTPGQYVCICVTDTGSGMGPEVIARAFEPFFTTKPLGQGTGLGLSMVYGFAKQSEGHLKIYSEVGTGTTVKLYLPRHRGEAPEEEPAGPAQRAPRAEAGETVLVVEDEPVVRDLIVDVLQDLGYRALEAADGPLGLKLLQSRGRIDLLVTDVGLPGLNGRQLADHARERRPDLKVLFITGYAENATLANGFLDPGMEMITKPFAVEALATKIRSMIRED